MISPYTVSCKLDIHFDDATHTVRISAPSGREFCVMTGPSANAWLSIKFALEKFAGEIGELAANGKL